MSVGTIVLLAYLAGCLATLVPTARWYMQVFGDKEPEPSDYVFAAALGLCTSWLWPLYIPGWWIVQMLKNDKPKVNR